MKTMKTLALTVALAAAGGLAACGKNETATSTSTNNPNVPATGSPATGSATSGTTGTVNTTGPTAGQRADTATDNAAARAGDATREAGRAASDAARAVTSSVSDSMITGLVKTKLAADADLKALQIDVDTSYGRVTLTGTAPSAAARDRATDLARATEGVKDVNNKLVVASR